MHSPPVDRLRDPGESLRRPRELGCQPRDGLGAVEQFPGLHRRDYVFGDRGGGRLDCAREQSLRATERAVDGAALLEQPVNGSSPLERAADDIGIARNGTGGGGRVTRRRVDLGGAGEFSGRDRYTSHGHET